MATGIPEAVERLIVSHIDSVEQLEVLLLLHRTAPRVWSASEVAAELRIDPSSALRRLEDLVGRGMATAEGAGTAYHPGNPHDRDVRALADAYRERRVTVITLIFTKPKSQADPVRELAEAFRLKRGPRDG